MVYKFFDKKSSGSRADTSVVNKSVAEPNYQLANKLHKHFIRKFKRKNVYSNLYI